ncbi:hypothetical protein DXG03_003443 [Asterophora parasitica]|uniref:CCAAT-binding factor domain-containing protein n=1 Tax=Asterophora parasitica TaxID=117018 RepID=A0A9P7KAR7_9AGAR|nr:hypothetical protein DXG03_003443 [Asterophora parasitica]
MAGPIRSLPPPTKKRKVQADSGTIQSIQKLEADLTRAVATNASLNPLADLLDLALATKTPSQTSKAIYALYRVFVLIIADDKLGLGGDEAAKVVKAWLWDRLNIYVDYLGGLLKDEEKTLRTSALQILLSLQKHLSTSYTKSTPSQPQFHISHFRKIVSYLLLCPPSTRPQENEVLNTNIDPDVLHQFYETWFSVHDDVRWFFLRESATLLNSTSPKTAPTLAANLLAVLERLNTFPTEKAELNSWWVAEIGTRPPKPKKSKKGSADAASSDEDDENDKDGEEDEDDWRKFFDEESAATDGKPKGPSARLHKLTIHQSLHALPSHRAVFTRAWLALLPRLSISEGNGKALAMRALNVMHRGVMPHLTRPVLVMDWVGASVDYGGAVGLLALNALFVLMKEYNLDYPSFYTRLYTFLDRDVLHLKHRARFFRMTELFLSSTHLPSNLLASFIKRLSRLSLTAPPAAIVMVIPFTYNVLKRVSTLVKIFSEAFTKPSYAMEDFLDHTYGTLYDAEANRKIKKEPALAMEVGKRVELFPVEHAQEEDLDDMDLVTAGGDAVGDLWVFA